MTARPEVVALLTEFDAERADARQRFVRRDGRPFTAEDTELIAAYIHAVVEDTEDRRAPAEGP